jgi:RNA polymerase sigma factor (TIGR02999 family)
VQRGRRLTRSGGDVTQLLRAWGRGDHAALDELWPLVQGELRRRAAAYLRRERPDHTLEPTALVHEAYLRLVGQGRVAWHDRMHFFALAAQMMRRILVDHARGQHRKKRAGGAVHVALDEAVAHAGPSPYDFLLLDQALCELAAVAGRHARIVELRYFGGLTEDEVADVLGVSRATVTREWQTARAWLYRRMTEGRRATSADVR